MEPIFKGYGLPLSDRSFRNQKYASEETYAPRWGGSRCNPVSRFR